MGNICLIQAHSRLKQKNTKRRHVYSLVARGISLLRLHVQVGFYVRARDRTAFNLPDSWQQINKSALMVFVDLIRCRALTLCASDITL